MTTKFGLFWRSLFVAGLFAVSLASVAATFDGIEVFENDIEDDAGDPDDINEDSRFPGSEFACKKATAAQIAIVNDGNNKTTAFLRECAKATGGSSWCAQLTRPNPASIDIFRCTYGTSQVHRLIHPDTSTWTNAFQAVNLVEDLEAQGLKVCLIYNWWRPEPYNVNVGGAAGRHPFATSVDVRFCSTSDMEKAFLQLCRWRAEGRLRALGYYGSTALHFGIGDRTGNTWGKNCPAFSPASSY